MLNSYKRHQLIILAVDLILITFIVLSIISMSFKPRLTNTDIITYSQSTTEESAKFSIQKINEYNIDENINLETITDFLVKGDQVSLELKNDAIPQEIRIKLEPYYSDTYIIVLSIVVIFFIIPAIYLLFVLTDTKIAYITHWLMISSAIMISCDWGSLALYPLFLNFILRTLYSASYLFLPIIFLHFSLNSPVKKFPRIESYFKYLYILLIIPLIPIGIINYSYLQFPHTNNLNIVATYDFLQNVLLKNILLPLALLLIINLIHSYYTIKDTVARTRLLWIFSGFIIGFVAFAFLYRLPITFIGKPIISETLMLFVQIISPITLFIAIYKYQFLNIHLIIKRSVVYFTVILILTLGYIGIVYLLNWWIYKVLDTEHIFSNALAAILIAIGFHPLKVLVQKAVDKNFFKIHFDISIVSKEFRSKTANLISEQSILSHFYETIVKYIPIENIAILRLKNQNNEVYSILDINCEIDDASKHLIKEVCLNNPNQGIFFRNSKTDVDVDDLGLFTNPKYSELIIPSYINNELSIILILGPKKSTFPYNDNDIELINTLLANTNTELQRLELQKMLMFQQEEITKLEEISEMKSFFVSSVSHELKTPLTAIKLFTEILSSSNNLPADQRQEYFNIINGECDRLNRLINNILDFSKIERGAKVYNFEPIELNSLIDKALKICLYNLKMNKFEYHYSKTEQRCFVLGDSDTLTEVFINLIDNAIKYSSDIKFLSIELLISDSHCIIEIIDKGIGIKEEDISRIFDPYYRSSTKETRKAGGVGIGLSLVKSIITAHKGKIKVESKLNEGTKFIISLPILETNG